MVDAFWLPPVVLNETETFFWPAEVYLKAIALQSLEDGASG